MKPVTTTRRWLLLPTAGLLVLLGLSASSRSSSRPVISPSIRSQPNTLEIPVWAQLASLMIGATGFTIGVAQILMGITQGRTLQHITRSISTRYLGPFPKSLPRITSLLFKAQKNAVICCDYVAYGALLDQARATAYLNAVTHANTRYLTMFTLDDDALEQHMRRFVVIEDTDEIRPERKNDVEQFMINHVPQAFKRDPGRATVADFVDAPRRRDRDLITDLHLRPKRLSEALPAYFWIADPGSKNAQAIFSIVPLSDDALEYAFETSV